MKKVSFTAIKEFKQSENNDIIIQNDIINNNYNAIKGIKITLACVLFSQRLQHINKRYYGKMNYVY